MRIEFEKTKLEKENYEFVHVGKVTLLKSITFNSRQIQNGGHLELKRYEMAAVWVYHPPIEKSNRTPRNWKQYMERPADIDFSWRNSIKLFMGSADKFKLVLQDSTGQYKVVSHKQGESKEKYWIKPERFEESEGYSTEWTDNITLSLALNPVAIDTENVYHAVIMNTHPYIPLSLEFKGCLLKL